VESWFPGFEGSRFPGQSLSHLSRYYYSA